MEKKVIISLITLMVISVGVLSGCTNTTTTPTIGKDDKVFIDVANGIISDLYIVTESNIYSKHSRTAIYRTDLSHYTLSDRCDGIRWALFQSFDFIDQAYDWIDQDEHTATGMIDIANTWLMSARKDTNKWILEH